MPREGQFCCAVQRAQEGTPAGSSTGGGSAPKTPWRTPPPTFAEMATPLTAVAASGWQQHYDDDEAGEGAHLNSHIIDHIIIT